jgi:hypothetical protein
MANSASNQAKVFMTILKGIKIWLLAMHFFNFIFDSGKIKFFQYYMFSAEYFFTSKKIMSNFLQNGLKILSMCNNV